MTQISITEAVMISIGCIITVFIVLIGLQLIMTMFKYLPANPIPEKPVLKGTPPINSKETVLASDSEEEEVAMLLALILANDNQQDKTYKIQEIKRTK